jgi:hypothetical protein
MVDPIRFDSLAHERSNYFALQHETLEKCNYGTLVEKLLGSLLKQTVA